MPQRFISKLISK